MSTYYAVCNVNGPVSVLLIGNTYEAAIADFVAGNKQTWIDEQMMDVEFDFNCRCGDMNEEEFDNTLESFGCKRVCDLSPIDDRHLKDGWYLWVCED